MWWLWGKTGSSGNFDTQTSCRCFEDADSAARLIEETGLQMFFCAKCCMLIFAIISTSTLFLISYSNYYLVLNGYFAANKYDAFPSVSESKTKLLRPFMASCKLNTSSVTYLVILCDSSENIKIQNF